MCDASSMSRCLNIENYQSRAAGRIRADMIFIVVRFPVRPERADEWLSIVSDFTSGHAVRTGKPVLRLVTQRR